MNCLRWSPNALSIFHKFYHKDFIVYVEGDDDIIFWQHRIELTNPSASFETKKIIEADGMNGTGKCELHKMSEDIIKNNITNTLVATDCDYNKFLSAIPKHRAIIYTYGHSIENSIYCPIALNDFLRIRLRNASLDFIPQITEWYKNQLPHIAPLIILDILNEKYKMGLPIFPNGNCLCYLKHGGTSPDFDITKIRSKYEKFSCCFQAKDIEDVKVKISKSGDFRFIPRGHVVASAIRILLQHLIDKEHGDRSISDNCLYENFISHCRMQCNCCDMKHIKKSINSAIRAIR